ncbi:MAG: hypothetical protein RLZZ505_258 [Verrucomicrobiota bacterium]|jgi:uncharacterized protein YdiU (UPF0061 family)
MNSKDNHFDPDWRWEHSYTQLPSLFFTRVSPTPVQRPAVVVLNEPLALSLGLNPDQLEAGIFTGNIIPPGADPIAQAYAGHQFGHFTGLGDGRAILLGEHRASDGTRWDIQLKGPGRTPYSRGGDGRAALGPMLREYVISEAMHALGVPTTRSLAVATTGEKVHRAETLPGAVLTRVAASHIRVGTFQWAAAHEDTPALQALADYTRERHFPEIPVGETHYIDFFEAVMERQASLVAAWLHVGFIHGVMNTDNMALSGETIDYGPCAFMDAYDPNTVFSSIDHAGRYAYGKQPEIARWNLARLAEAMLPLFHPERKEAVDLANEALGKFEGRFQSFWLCGMRSKLGLFTKEEDDAPLVQALLDAMQSHRMDFTNTFRTLSDESAAITCPFAQAELIAWHDRWKQRLVRQPQDSRMAAEIMRKSNPTVIPRNHLVEEALTAASEQGDLGAMNRLLAVLSRPYECGHSALYTAAPPAGSPPYQTFCGT